VPDDFATIPAGVLHNLSDKLGKLPTPDPYQSEIQTAFSQALQAWQANPETASNSLVVLSRPVEAITPILKASLQSPTANYDVRFFLSSYHRPIDPLNIPGHLQRELAPEKATSNETPSAPVTETDMAATRPTVMVIPSLEQCFLRCIQGWEGIEYFQSLSTQDTSRFWVFGCNHWAWAFLDKVSQVGAYLEQVVSLPELSGDDLETWLQPLLTASIDTQGLAANLPLQIKTDGESFWGTLASVSKGISTVAAHLWLQSLHIKAMDLTPEGTLAADAKAVYLWQTKPALPSLMTLTVLDRYILHSLLLHGEMTRSHLALSLGEAERNIRSRVQVLRREGIILQRGRRLSVQPAHYPKLYYELSNNNFLIGEE
jgi:hypothetical protein